MGFRATMRARQPHRALVDVTESDGLDAVQHDLVLRALRRDPSVVGVYSIGGGNVATVSAFAELGRPCAVFVAHDLDGDNRRLLADGHLSAVLHHDLRRDVRAACHVVMQAHGALPGPVGPHPSTIEVVTPYNLPPA